jgi:integrase
LTGARLSELLGLPWRHVDLTMGTATIAQTVHLIYGSRKRGVETRLIWGEPKSKQSRRVLAIPAALTEELRALRAEQDEARAVLGDRYADLGDRGPLVFCQPDGRVLHQSDVRREFHRLLRTARLPRIRFHDLRHGAASLRLAQGDSPRLVQELLGHSTAAFTLQVYSHLLPGMQGQSAAKLEARLLGRSPETI